MLGFREYIPIILLLPMLACTAAPSSALNNNRVVNFTHCALPRDQGRGSLHGAWGSLPIPIVFDTDFYVTDGGGAADALRGSEQTWNTWASLRGFSSAFSLKNDGSGITAGHAIPELTDCSQASYSSSLPDTVGIWKISTAGFHRNQRSSCGQDATGANLKIMSPGVQGQTDWIIQSGRIIGASVLLNFDSFNSPGTQHIDVQSLLLHELGHVLGLLHSCNGSSGSSIDSTTAPACFQGGVLSVNPEYSNAVMFPFLEADQVRRDLKQNDYNRINCLY